MLGNGWAQRSGLRPRGPHAVGDTAALRGCSGSGGLRGPWTTLPHHKLFAYELCLSLVTLVAKVRIADAQLRAQARKSAASAALDCAEGAARQTRADKSRAYIALCECCEACAAIEIAGARGACSAADVLCLARSSSRARARAAPRQRSRVAR